MTTKKSSGKKKDIQKKPSDDSLKSQINELKKQIKENEDKFLRSLAELKNYQKRMEKEVSFCIEDTSKKYISELIDIHELLKQALKDNNPKKGLKLIIDNIENFFKKEQIQYIDCIGKKFDHNIHHAITTIEKDDCEDNTIIEEVKKGYMINDKVLRPSQVIVSKKK